MLFNSLTFLIFFPLVLIIYFLLPQKIRWIWLLISSYYFYMSWNAAYALLLAFASVVTWLSGIFINKYKANKKKQKFVVAGSFIVNLSILAYYKYAVFFVESFNQVLTKFHINFAIPTFDILLPVGISFYIFQALSYTMDVYREEIDAEHNFFRYALFVSFFPQLVAGPIERSKNLLGQVSKPTTFSYDNLRIGFIQMLWGFFLKLVVADNIAIVVDTVFSDLNKYPGWYIVVAVILFAFQIYGDFGGYSLIAIGSAKILGFELMTNFNAPYYSQSVSEFWRRWHISLSTWFRDYLYIPLGGNRKGKIRKNINLMIVFLVSGLWHGAAWHYVIWGGANGLFQVIGGYTKRIRKIISDKLRVSSDAFTIRVCRTLLTFILIDFCWLFFRANSMGQALEAIKSMATVHNTWILLDGSLFSLGLSNKKFNMLLLTILFVMIVDYFKYKSIDLVKHILRQPFIMRNIIYVVLVMSVLIFGCWGSGYDAAAFLYFQF